ncbi:hemicentin-2 isoform X6 [Cotesia glomerata]|uniref:hemicentin-2 isoform X6 n=1 Tax=Cotesia glomerata TaxID=32391 RepID=UPI001D034400|nr:hemicentin-2 isoform X6 [Cotesia glomerata]
MTPLVTYTIVFMVNIFFHSIVEGMEPWKKSEKNGEQGSEIQLPCILKSPKCGGLHSIKWYRGSQRILIFSESAGITRGNNDIAARSTMNYNQNATKTYLKISDLKLEDEGLYKCEATYLAVNRECNNVQHITLNTTVRPKFLRITEEDDNTNLTSGTILGPINEGTLMTLNCESDQGKPVPTVEWYKGDKRLKAIGSTKVRENGVGIGSSVLQLQVGRSELGATFTCKISSLALAEPLTVDIKLDVHVRPLKMDVKGVVGHVVSGTKILLECKVSAARPPANVTWYNGTDFLTNDNDRFEMFETKIDDNSDGTSETSSYLAFTASEYDNGQTFSCFAENSVTRIEGIKPMKEATTIEVLYAPIITMRPANITVNETEDFVIICNYEANPAGLTSVKWLQNDQELELNEDHYEGGVTEQTSLTVKNASASDMGTYKCVLSNSVGETTPENTVDVSVLYKPIVKVLVEPEVPINEADRLNVSLTCYAVKGNPINLNAVRWYLDGDLLKELPDCNIKNNSTITLNMDDTLTFCDIDPSKLLLEAVGRSFHGNYSCEGRNDAGWGLISPSTPVIVYYKPGPAMISYKPKRVIKGSSLNITCTVTDPGRPAVTGYKWIRGMHRLADQEKSILSIDSVNLRTKANFTCIAYNEAGDGDPATTFIDVAAPPAFINPLAPYHGYVYNAVNVSIGCRVECSPICNVSWIKNNEPINFTVIDRYYVTNVYHPADQSTSDFESIQSNLTWNLDKWPNKQLDRFKDNDNYTCISSDNDVGKGVHSTTHFQVEFPPENMTISKKIIDVIVDFIPDSVKCGAVAHPEPTFRWYRQGSTETISQSPVLVFETKVPKRSNGTYFCEATNRHGTLNISTYLNVLYKPECQINKERINGEDYLVCTAVGNPKESNFSWSLKSDNDSLGQLAEIRQGQSYLLLDTAVTNFRTYVCIANNSIGSSLPCERGVPARQGRAGNLPWWFQLEGDLLIIVIIIIVTVVIAIVVCCVIVYLICRRKQMHAKYSNRMVTLEERQHPDGGPPSPTESIRSHGRCSSLHSNPVPRWPLKPGVLVHINRTHSLSSGLNPVPLSTSNHHIHTIPPTLPSTTTITAAVATTTTTTETISATTAEITSSPTTTMNTMMTTNKNYKVDRYRTRGDEIIVTRRPIKPFRRGKIMTITQMGIPIHNIVHDEGMIARANRLKAIFSSQLKEPDSFPGISREKTAVTYKRIVPRQRMSYNTPTLAASNCDTSADGTDCGGGGDVNINANSNVSRKRKKPGADPGHQGNKNSHIDSVSEGLQPESDGKTFYENLPFHGIQTPPNKCVASPKFARVSALHGTTLTSLSPTCSNSRPLSRATSLCAGSAGSAASAGSSGYESTPSHLGPHYSYHNMPRNNSPELKYNTFKPRRRKQLNHSHQFYSLRLCRKHNNNDDNNNNNNNQQKQVEKLEQQRCNFQLYAVPIIKSCPHKIENIKNSISSKSFNSISTVESTTTIPSSNIITIPKKDSILLKKKSSLSSCLYSHIKSNELLSSLSSSSSSSSMHYKSVINNSQVPPVPTPRRRKTDISQHIYQNIPRPIFPMDSAKLDPRHLYIHRSCACSLLLTNERV